jgi:hypothetical protein
VAPPRQRPRCDASPAGAPARGRTVPTLRTSPERPASPGGAPLPVRAGRHGAPRRRMRRPAVRPCARTRARNYPENFFSKLVLHAHQTCAPAAQRSHPCRARPAQRRRWPPLERAIAGLRQRQLVRRPGLRPVVQVRPSRLKCEGSAGHGGGKAPMRSPWNSACRSAGIRFEMSEVIALASDTELWRMLRPVWAPQRAGNRS